MKLVALVGSSGCGKSAVASILGELGYHRLRFSQPIKDMLKAIGLSDDHTEGTLKESPCSLLSGKTPRYAMQTLGTEWARNMMGKNFWLNLWKEKASQHDWVVVEDCRFANEAALVKQMGGELWKIQRSGCVYSGHPSEKAMEFIKGDILISNDGSVKELSDKVRHLTRTLDRIAWEGDIGENRLDRARWHGL